MACNRSTHIPFVTGKDCADLYKKGHTTDGVYSIDPDGKGAFRVRCDMTTSRGGWTIIQRRIDGSVDFFRYWKDYKNGFGDPTGEYWLGLDKINRLTNSGANVIRFDLGDTTGVTKYAEYSFFAVASENVKYKLSVGTYSGIYYILIIVSNNSLEMKHNKGSLLFFKERILLLIKDPDIPKLFKNDETLAR